MIHTSAPGKFVLLGEHAVVYGKPAITLAIDMRFSMRATPSKEYLVNGKPVNIHSMSPHMIWISNLHGNNPVSIFVDKRIPVGSGLGSSAALSVAYSAAIRSIANESLDHEEIAKEAYAAEFFAQGRGSPMDTSVCTNGGGVALNVPYDENDFLWHIDNNGHSWDVSKIDVPEMTFVIGNTGVQASTGPLVEKVGNARETDKRAFDAIEEIGELTLEGLECLKRNDWTGLGKSMNRDQELLSFLGVSSPELDELIEVSLPYSYGAKLTGSGGGGCMVALTNRPKDVAKAIRGTGAKAHIVKAGVPGVEIKE